MPRVHATWSRDFPATPPERVRQWFNELADTNVGVREQARVALMGLRVDELGILREIIDASRPVGPAQAAVLRDIVLHVYVSATRFSRLDDRLELYTGNPYPGMRPSGFFGVSLEAMPFTLAPPARAGDELERVLARAVLIRETWPGFAGFRYLRPGDIVVAIKGEVPEVAPTLNLLQDAVSSAAPGEPFAIRVLRQGRIIDVSIPLSARPPWVPVPRAINPDPSQVRLKQNDRMRFAERYWNNAFAPLLISRSDGIS
jgi:hypothetical protein